MMPHISVSAAIASTLVFLVATFGPDESRAAHSESPRYTLAVTDSALYTEEQATSGAVVFGKVCAECHEKADITKADFRSKWNGRTLFELFELVRTTMPDSNPGGLTRDEYAGTMAYILKANGLPAGTTPVMPDSAAMSNAKLSLPPL